MQASVFPRPWALLISQPRFLYLRCSPGLWCCYPLTSHRPPGTAASHLSLFLQSPGQCGGCFQSPSFPNQEHYLRSVLHWGSQNLSMLAWVASWFPITQPVTVLSQSVLFFSTGDMEEKEAFHSWPTNSKAQLHSQSWTSTQPLWPTPSPPADLLHCHT